MDKVEKKIKKNNLRKIYYKQSHSQFDVLRTFVGSDAAMQKLTIFRYTTHENHQVSLYIIYYRVSNTDHRCGAYVADGKIHLEMLCL